MRIGKLLVVSAAVLLIGAALVVLWLVLRPSPPPPPTAPVETLPPGVAFIDRFASLDARRWRLSDRPRDGWHVDNDLRPAQVGVANDGLAIVLDTAGGEHGAHYTSGEIQSAEAFRYGYFETRMRVPRGAGVVTGFFTFTGAGEGGRANEIDVEILGRATRRAYLTYHVGGRGTEKVIDLPFDAADGFHIYAFEWAPDAIRWYVDAQLVHEVRDARVARLNRPQQLILNLWGTEALYRWAGRIDPAQAPWRLEIACVAQAQRYMGRTLC